MTLNEWIKKVGYREAGKLLKVNPKSVLQWRSFDCLPRALTMREICRLSKGKVTYESIIEPFAKFHNY